MKFLKKIVTPFIMAAALLGITHKKSDTPKQASNAPVRQQQSAEPSQQSRASQQMQPIATSPSSGDTTGGEDQVVNDPNLAGQTRAPQQSRAGQQQQQARATTALPEQAPPQQSADEGLSEIGDAGAALADVPIATIAPQAANLAQQQQQEMLPIDPRGATADEIAPMTDADWEAALAQLEAIPADPVSTDTTAPSQQAASQQAASQQAASQQAASQQDLKPVGDVQATVVAAPQQSRAITTPPPESVGMVEAFNQIPDSRRAPQSNSQQTTPTDPQGLRPLLGDTSNGAKVRDVQATVTASPEDGLPNAPPVQRSIAPAPVQRQQTPPVQRQATPSTQQTPATQQTPPAQHRGAAAG